MTGSSSAAGDGRGGTAGDDRPAIGVDIGGTKVAAGVVDGAGRVLARRVRPTPSGDPRAVERAIVDLVGDLRAEYPAEVVGIGAAGFVDAARERVTFAPHLAWRDEPLQRRVSRALGLPVIVENDANAAVWAEWRFGAARGESHVVCLTLGTGIGGGILIEGRVRRGRWGMAGEFGHLVVVPGGHPCECGNRGCLEQYVSGNVLGRLARERVASGVPGATGLLDRAGGDPAALAGPLVTAAARDGDPLAADLLADAGRWLGLGLANLAAALDPGVFVIGGGACAAGELLLGPARESFGRGLTGRGFRPEARIAAAALGADAGLVGAADLARQG